MLQCAGYYPATSIITRTMDSDTTAAMDAFMTKYALTTQTDMWNKLVSLSKPCTTSRDTLLSQRYYMNLTQFETAFHVSQNESFTNFWSYLLNGCTVVAPVAPEFQYGTAIFIVLLVIGIFAIIVIALIVALKQQLSNKNKELAH